MERSALTYRELLERAESGRPEKFSSEVRQDNPSIEQRARSLSSDQDIIDDLEQEEKRQGDHAAIGYKFAR